MKSKKFIAAIACCFCGSATLLTSQSMEWWTPMSSFTTAETAPLLT